MTRPGSGTGASGPGDLGFSRLVQFAVGNAGKNALTSIVEVYGLYYCTELMGVSPSLAGAVIMVSLAWDAFADPLIGYRADRRIARREREPAALRVDAKLAGVQQPGALGPA